MTFYDHTVSRYLSAGAPFAALIMAAMRCADTTNLALLREAWPDVAAELDARDSAPGGVLPDDPEYVKAQAGRHLWAAGLDDLQAEMDRATEHPH